MENKIIKTKHWLFDFDGTLVDSMGYWAESMVSVLDDFNIPYSDDIVNIITPLGGKGTIEYFIKLGLNLPPEEIALIIGNKLTPKYRDIILLKDGVRDCLEYMKKEGYGLHILTASPHAWLDPCLDRNGVFELFDNVWSSDDFGTGKTDPEIYVMAAERIGAGLSDITFIDDNINADLAAMRSGVRVLGVYDKSSDSDTERIKASTHGYIHDFSELKERLSEN